MKLSRLLPITLLVSAYATITVVHINMAQPKPVAEATLDMIEIMTRAFDESEGGEGGSGVCPNGGYAATGDRELITITKWKVTFDCGYGVSFSLFDALAQAIGFAETMAECNATISSDFYAGYDCDFTNSNLCWVCNLYKVSEDPA